jgi:uncharacterized membrane protein YsdA (DUF1294 family)
MSDLLGHLGFSIKDAWWLALTYLVAINTATLLTFWADKERARQHLWRISESSLLSLALFGGSAAAVLAQYILRHKNRKEPFRTILLGIVGFQVGGAVGLAWYF